MSRSLLTHVIGWIGVMTLVAFLGSPAWAQPDGSRVVAPSHAFAGGQLVGTVVDPQGEPVANAPVQVSSTLSGTVIEAETNDEGTFTAEVPELENEEDEAGEGLSLEVVGLATTLTVALVTAIPDGVAHEPPPYTEVGRDIEIVGDWPEVTFTPGTEAAPTGAPIEVPVGRSISPDGMEALTTYYAVPSLPTGPLTVATTAPDGTTWRTPTYAYRIVSASLDQEQLSSGQETEFVYTFDFGESEEERAVPLRVDIEGPIRYELDGLPQVMMIEASGLATYTGTIRAIRGSPTGIPFAINATVGIIASIPPAPPPVFGPQPASVVKDSVRTLARRICDLMKERYFGVTDDAWDWIWEKYTSDNRNVNGPIWTLYGDDFLTFALDNLLNPPDELRDKLSEHTRERLRIFEPPAPRWSGPVIGPAPDPPPNACPTDCSYSAVLCRLQRADPSFKAWYDRQHANIGRGATVRRERLRAFMRHYIDLCERGLF